MSHYKELLYRIKTGKIRSPHRIDQKTLERMLRAKRVQILVQLSVFDVPEREFLVSIEDDNGQNK